MSQHADLEISLHRHDAQSDQVRLRLRLPDADAPQDSSALVPRFDLDALGALAADPVRYGQALTDALLADEALKLFLAQARALAADRSIPLRTRLYLDPHAPELHELRWETLRDPRPGASAFLFTDETVPFSRYLSSDDWRPVATRPRGDLKALVVVADPRDRDEWDLAAVDVAGELARARAGLGAMKVAALCRPDGAGDPGPGLSIFGPPTLKNLVTCLRDGYDVLYLACHGKLLAGGEAEGRHPLPWIWLEDDEGNADPVPAVEATMSGSSRPGLVTRLESRQIRFCSDFATRFTSVAADSQPVVVFQAGRWHEQPRLCTRNSRQVMLGLWNLHGSPPEMYLERQGDNCGAHLFRF